MRPGAANLALDRMTRSAVTQLLRLGRPWRAPRHRSAFRLAVRKEKKMHRQTLRMSLALAATGWCFAAHHARDAGQRSAQRRTGADRLTQVCEWKRRSPANQADGAARTSARRAIGDAVCPAAHPQR